MNNIQKVKTKIKLTSFIEDDSTTLFNWINDRELVNFGSTYTPVHFFSHNEWFKTIGNRNDIKIFAIRTIIENKLIGSCQLYKINFINRSAEVQIRIGDSSYRGKGIGSEAIQMITYFGFMDLNLNRLYAQIFSTNEASLKAFKNVRYQNEGTLREAEFVDGQYVNIEILSILRNEFI